MINGIAPMKKSVDLIDAFIILSPAFCDSVLNSLQQKFAAGGRAGDGIDIQALCFQFCHLLSLALRRQIRMAQYANRIAAFEIMTRNARLHIAAREHRMLAAAAAFAEANEIRGTMR
jgi:hypothetical protein